MASIYTVDILREVVLYLIVDDLAKLYATNDRRFQEALRAPSVLSTLRFTGVSDEGTTDQDMPISAVDEVTRSIFMRNVRFAWRARIVRPLCRGELMGLMENPITDLYVGDTVYIISLEEIARMRTKQAFVSVVDFSKHWLPLLANPNGSEGVYPKFGRMFPKLLNLDIFFPLANLIACKTVTGYMHQALDKHLSDPKHGATNTKKFVMLIEELHRELPPGLQSFSGTGPLWDVISPSMNSIMPAGLQELDISAINEMDRAYQLEDFLLPNLTKLCLSPVRISPYERVSYASVQKPNWRQVEYIWPPRLTKLHVIMPLVEVEPLDFFVNVPLPPTIEDLAVGRMRARGQPPQKGKAHAALTLPPFRNDYLPSSLTSLSVFLHELLTSSMSVAPKLPTSLTSLEFFLKPEMRSKDLDPLTLDILQPLIHLEEFSIHLIRDDTNADQQPPRIKWPLSSRPNWAFPPKLRDLSICTSVPSDVLALIPRRLKTLIAFFADFQEVIDAHNALPDTHLGLVGWIQWDRKTFKILNDNGLGANGSISLADVYNIMKRLVGASTSLVLNMRALFEADEGDVAYEKELDPSAPALVRGPAAAARNLRGNEDNGDDSDDDDAHFSDSVVQRERRYRRAAPFDFLPTVKTLQLYGTSESHTLCVRMAWHSKTVLQDLRFLEGMETFELQGLPIGASMKWPSTLTTLNLMYCELPANFNLTALPSSLTKLVAQSQCVAIESRPMAVKLKHLHAPNMYFTISQARRIAAHDMTYMIIAFKELDDWDMLALDKLFQRVETKTLFVDRAKLSGACVSSKTTTLNYDSLLDESRDAIAAFVCLEVTKPIVNPIQYIPSSVTAIDFNIENAPYPVPLSPHISVLPKLLTHLTLAIIKKQRLVLLQSLFPPTLLVANLTFKKPKQLSPIAPNWPPHLESLVIALNDASTYQSDKDKKDKQKNSATKKKKVELEPSANLNMPAKDLPRTLTRLVFPGSFGPLETTIELPNFKELTFAGGTGLTDVKLGQIIRACPDAKITVERADLTGGLVPIEERNVSWQVIWQSIQTVLGPQVTVGSWMLSSPLALHNEIESLSLVAPSTLDPPNVALCSPSFGTSSTSLFNLNLSTLPAQWPASLRSLEILSFCSGWPSVFASFRTMPQLERLFIHAQVLDVVGFGAELPRSLKEFVIKPLKAAGVSRPLELSYLPPQLEVLDLGTLHVAKHDTLPATLKYKNFVSPVTPVFGGASKTGFTFNAAQPGAFKFAAVHPKAPSSSPAKSSSPTPQFSFGSKS